jgi:ubiquinone biosynthesis protein
VSTLKASAIPTPLVPIDERPRVVIVPPSRRSRLPAVSVTFRLIAWGAAMSWLRVRRRGSPAEYGRRFRLLLEDLGGLWVKLGQLLSLRVDLFPVEFCRELSQLQVKALGFLPDLAIQIIEEDIGAPIDRLFSEFEQEPFAAASMGQVHLARLRESGSRVAVKVQRPHLSETFSHQLRVIGWITWLLEAAGYRTHMRWSDLVWELTQIMREEVDCRYEGATTRRMRRNLRAHGIHVPQVFYATTRVLVTEFVDGVLMADYIHMIGTHPERLRAWRAENNVDPQTVGRDLSISLLRQFVEDNLFHGDLHPGNIMLLRDSRVALIDFGACSFTERQYLEWFQQSVAALASRDYSKAADLSLLLSGTLPSDTDLDAMRSQFIRAMQAWASRTAVREVPYPEKSVAVIYNALIRILYDHECTMEWTLLRIRRAQETLDASLLHLYPDADYMKVTEQYFREAERRHVSSTPPLEAAAAMLSSAASAIATQENLEEYTLFQSAIIRRHAQVLQHSTNTAIDLLATMVRQIALVLLLAGAGGVMFLLAQHRAGWLAFLDPDGVARLAGSVPRLDFQIWLAAASSAMFGSVASWRLAQRLRRVDVRPADRVATV